jgi:hypothetical protein
MTREVMYLLMSKIRVNRFRSADSIFCRSPSENIITIRIDNRSGFYRMNSLSTEGGGEKLVVRSLPGTQRSETLAGKGELTTGMRR